MGFLKGGRVARWAWMLGAALSVVALAAACAGAAPTPTPTPTKAPPTPTATATPVRATPTPGKVAAVVGAEMVHAAYIDLSTNISDMRSRITQWEGGDQNSLNIAVEKAERIEALLHAIQWPAPLSEPVEEIEKALPAVEAALKNKDLAAAKQAVTPIGEHSHDLTHDFYGKWVPARKAADFGSMAAHAAYLDLSGNISDMRSRITQWEGGDQNSLNTAMEKAERIEALLHGVPWPPALDEAVEMIEKALPAVETALKAKDLAAAKQAVTPVGEASHDLTHAFYEKWVSGKHGAEDAGCAQAGYLDLSVNVSDLRSRITQWEGGDQNSLNIATEKAERIEALLHAIPWPAALSEPVEKIEKALPSVEAALKAKDVAAAKQAVAPIGEASHDLTHAFYEKWVPGMMGTMSH
ncbi:MAG: hypothetical protein HYY00_07060 [Chloroflexi bacterium]|nr:hypothetical protein [Chloroflexota bacterium]